MSQIIGLLFIISFSISVFAQQAPLSPAIPAPTTSAASTATEKTAAAKTDDESEKPNGRRIRRFLNLVYGVDHDEEILIPDIELVYKGRVDAFDMKRIKKTDFFRISPKKVGSGIVTIHNKKTGQILVEIRYDIRNDDIEKTMREVQSLLGDIEGIEFKIVGGLILLDGYALIPKDLIRISQVVKTINTGPGGEKVKSLVSLSPLARKKIAEYIARDVNNPEVSITAVGDFIKLEGTVNSEAERKRITDLVGLYMPDLVIDIAPDTDNIKIVGRKTGGSVKDLIIDLMVVKKDEDKVEPPPKMIQIVAHFVEYNERYLKNYSFNFSPTIAAVDGQIRQPSGGSVTNDIASLVDRLIPKLNWAKQHGYVRVLDTASILVQDKQNADLTRNISVVKGLIQGPNGAQSQDIQNARVSINVTPIIKSERSGLIELNRLKVNLEDPNQSGVAKTDIITTISVRDRHSAAFAGTIKKKKDATFGGPSGAGAVFTFNQGKGYSKNTSNFVVFVTPIIKASASSGVDQVKKKFRLKE